MVEVMDFNVHMLHSARMEREQPFNNKLTTTAEISCLLFISSCELQLWETDTNWVMTNKLWTPGGAVETAVNSKHKLRMKG